jgi:hypothetical protein
MLGSIFIVFGITYVKLLNRFYTCIKHKITDISIVIVMYIDVPLFIHEININPSIIDFCTEGIKEKNSYNKYTFRRSQICGQF